MTLDKIVSYLRQTGYVYRGSEIYGGLANTFDYGPLGSLLKQNIKSAWIKRFVTETTTNVFLDSSILLNTNVWMASGHLKGFSDPLTECLECNNRFRADHLISEHDPSINPDGWSNDKLFNYLTEHKVVCPNCGKHKWTEIRKFNLMFKTSQGVIENESNDVYLRPETAQGIFINFKNIQRTTRRKVPFGVGQVGKAFRNEITPGNFIFRTREFEQLELEFFCKPNTEMGWFDYWLKEMQAFLKDLGLKEENVSLYEHTKEELSHYSNKTIDILYNYPWGFDELWGIASRTDFDLKAHEEESKEDLSYLDPETNEKYTPYVVEPSLGVERLFLAIIKEGYLEETLEDGTVRELLKIHSFLAPYKAAILPLIKNRHKDKAEEVYKLVSKEMSAIYDETQNIGRRYRRQDQIGTPFAVTIDDETINEGTVTVRERDSMAQEKVKIEDLVNYLSSKVKF